MILHQALLFNGVKKSNSLSLAAKRLLPLSPAADPGSVAVSRLLL